MKNKTAKQPLLFVDTVQRLSDVEEQVMYKTPQKSQKPIIQVGFIHTFSKTVEPIKQVGQIDSVSVDDIESVTVVMDEVATLSKMPQYATQEIHDILTYLKHQLRQQDRQVLPIVQVALASKTLIGQLQEVTPNELVLQTFNDGVVTIQIAELLTIQVLQR